MPAQSLSWRDVNAPVTDSRADVGPPSERAWYEEPGVLPLGERPAQERTAAPLIAHSAAAAPLPPPLLQRDPHAAPITVRTIIELAGSLRTFVTQEVNEQVAGAVARRQPTEASPSTSQPPACPPPASPPTDEDVRTILGKIRTMTQKERFRSGKLR